MRKFLIILLIFISQYAILVGQSTRLPKRPYQQIEFTDFKPDWYYTLKDTTIKDVVKYDTMSQFGIDPFVRARIVIDSFAIMLVHKDGTIQHDTAATVQCRSLSTGKLKWEFTSSGQFPGHRQAFKHAYKDSSGYLILIGVIEKVKSTMTSYYGEWSKDFLMTRRVLDLSSGKLKLEYIPDFNDTTLQPIFNNRSSSSNYTAWSNKLDSIIYLRQIRNSGKSIVVKYSLDQEGRQLLSPDTLFFERPTDIPYVNLIPLSTDKYLLVEKDSIKFSKVIFKILDDKFRVLERNVYDSIPWNYFMYLFGYIDSVLLLTTVSTEDGGSTLDYNCYLFDIHGKLVSHYIERNTRTNYILKFDRKSIIKFELKSEYKIPGKYYPVMYLSRSNENGTFDIVRKLVSKDSLRYLSWHRFYNNGDKYFVTTTETSFYDANPSPSQYNNQPDYFANAVGVMQIDLSELVLSNTIDEIPKVEDLTVTVYPNPTDDRLQINFAEQFDGQVGIYDMNGRLHKSIPAYDTDYMEISISDLNAGHYVLIGFARKDMKQKWVRKIVKL